MSKKKEQKESDLERKSMQQHKSNIEGTMFVIVMSLLYIFVGVCLLLLPQIKMAYVTYVICGLMIVYGVSMIIRYFISESYKNLHDYGFSIGTIAVVLGACALTRTADVTAHLPMYLGVCIMISSVVMLQNAIQMKILKNRAWFLVFIAAILGIICSVLILMDLQMMKGYMDLFTYWVMIVVGVISVIGMIMVHFSIRKFYKNSVIEDNTADGSEKTENLQEHSQSEEEKNDGKNKGQEPRRDALEDGRYQESARKDSTTEITLADVLDTKPEEITEELPTLDGIDTMMEESEK